MRLLWLLLLIVVLSGCESTRDTAARNSVLDRQIEALLPGVDLSFGSGDSLESPDFLSRRFDYKDRHRRTPYGHGFGLFDRESLAVLWVYLLPGDYPPHHAGWTDFDGDERPDIFFYSGEEDVTGTHIVFDRVVVDTFALTNFYPGFVIDYAYALVVEGVQDSIPDVLLPMDATDDAAFEARCLDPRVVSELDIAAAAEYWRIAGRFQGLNYTAEQSPDLFLFRRVRFLNFRDGWSTDVTARHRNHLRWRVAALETIRENVDDGCRHELALIVSHLEDLLASATSAP